MLEAPRWDERRFELDRQQAISNFRHERLEEPLEAYLEHFDRYQGIFEELLETTVDLVQIEPNALQVLGDERLLEAFRYLAGPPISRDDLMTVAEASSLNKKRLLADPDLVKRIIEIALTALDRRRFAWIADNRDPTECERTASVVASAALLATRRLGTERCREGKKSQELRVENALLRAGFKKVPTRDITQLPSAPNAGEFCGESNLGTRKADFIIRLWDQRVMALECKVSNSALNSVKRLNNDAAAKAEAWKRDFGETQIVPVAVISGVFKLTKLQEAQRRGLTIFWAHDLDVMLNWVEDTRTK